MAKKTKALTSKGSDLGSMLGKKIPAFSVHDSKGNVITQKALQGTKTLIYFYPKDDTPGCTLEGKDFSELHAEFKSLGVQIFGVSKDSVKSHDKFICKYGFSFELLSDENEQLCTIFDVIKEKNMYGKKYLGIERSTFVIDEDLKVIYEERKVTPAGHARAMADRLKS